MLKWEGLECMNCTPKVRQKKSNFWGAVQSMVDYIENVSKQEWIEGRKYFYGFEVK